MDEKTVLTERLFAISNSLFRMFYLHARIYERQTLQTIFTQTDHEEVPEVSFLSCLTRWFTEMQLMTSPLN